MVSHGDAGEGRKKQQGREARAPETERVISWNMPALPAESLSAVLGGEVSAGRGPGVEGVALFTHWG